VYKVEKKEKSGTCEGGEARRRGGPRGGEKGEKGLGELARQPEQERKGRSIRGEISCNRYKPCLHGGAVVCGRERARSAKGEGERRAAEEGRTLKSSSSSLREATTLSTSMSFASTWLQTLSCSVRSWTCRRERGSAPSRLERREREERAHGEVGLLEAVVVDLLDLDEVWWETGK
jgi:hypothetical protein